MRLQARNLLKAGYQVTVWNRSADKCKGLAAEGAKVASSAKEAAAAADITIAMLADPAAALAVAKEAAEGLAKGMRLCPAVHMIQINLSISVGSVCESGGDAVNQARGTLMHPLLMRRAPSRLHRYEPLSSQVLSHGQQPVRCS